MTNVEKLSAALFGNSAREHVDIKFWVGHGLDLTLEDVCGEAAKMLSQMDTMEGDREFAEAFTPREASDFVVAV